MSEVIGEVKEHHYNCEEGHSFSVMLNKEYVIEPEMPCVVEGCPNWSTAVSSNDAEISTNPVDLLQH